MATAQRMRQRAAELKEGLTSFEREESQGGRSTGGRSLRGDTAEQSAWNCACSACGPALDIN